MKKVPIFYKLYHPYNAENFLVCNMCILCVLCEGIFVLNF